MITLEDIQKATSILSGNILKTPLITSTWLNQKIKAEVFLKLENLQVTGSFKPRGAYIKLSRLSNQDKKKGIIAMSAGNHAQGVAYHAKRLGIPTKIIMPVNTPLVKVQKTKSHGADIEFSGQNLYESGLYAKELSVQTGCPIIHPYDDWGIITGQGSVALEMLQDEPALDTLLVPIGGGGLCSGMTIAAKGINPKIKVIGVQCDYSAEMTEFLFPQRVNKKAKIPVHTIAEGISVKATGEITRAVLGKYLDDILIVSEEQMESAVGHLLQEERIISEGSGAAGVAAMLAFPELFQGKKIGIVICGGNIDIRLLSNIMLRFLAREKILYPLELLMPDDMTYFSFVIEKLKEHHTKIHRIREERIVDVPHPKLIKYCFTLEIQAQEQLENLLNDIVVNQNIQITNLSS